MRALEKSDAAFLGMDLVTLEDCLVDYKNNFERD